MDSVDFVDPRTSYPLVHLPGLETKYCGIVFSSVVLFSIACCKTQPSDLHYLWRAVSASKSSTAVNSVNVFSSDRGTSAQPTTAAQPATTASMGGAGAASFVHAARTDSKAKSGANGSAEGVAGDSSWFLVKCLPLEMDDYHHGASQVLCGPRSWSPGAGS